MRATGMIRPVDKLGRIVIPKEIRAKLNFTTGAPIEIFTTESSVVLQKYQPGCYECGRVGVELYGEKVRLCKDCLAALAGN